MSERSERIMRIQALPAQRVTGRRTVRGMSACSEPGIGVAASPAKRVTGRRTVLA